MTDAAHAAVEEQLAGPGTSISVGQATLTGLRQPIVAILLLIALFTTITGKPLDGFLMLTVATLLAWDAARSCLAGPSTSGSPSSAGSPASAGKLKGRGRSMLIGLGWLSVGLAYAGYVGVFRRFSWPATFFVVALGCLMVAVAWQGPVRGRPALTGKPLRRAWLWGAVLMTGGLWELNSLLRQPHLTTDSYAHPTISALSDPLLASHQGRSVGLGVWLALGWFLAGR